MKVTQTCSCGQVLIPFRLWTGDNGTRQFRALDAAEDVSAHTDTYGELVYAADEEDVSYWWQHDPSATRPEHDIVYSEGHYAPYGIGAH